MATWRVRLSPSSQRDLAGILQYTAENFGSRQEGIYRKTVTMALTALRAGPDLRDSVRRDEIAAGHWSLHIARKGRRGRHLILYREGPARTIEVVRILHDAMDLARHLPPQR